MIRKCKIKTCRKPLPAMKDCATVYQEKNLCDELCSRVHDAANRAKYAERQRAKEAAKPRAARVTSRKKRKPRAGDDCAYLDWVKTQPCVLCGGPADDAHHITGRGFGGMGLTAPDLLTMPVCRADHNLIHESPAHWDWQYEWVVKTIARAVQDGIL